MLRRADIQGNILGAYGKEGFPKGRAILLHVSKPEKGRQFLDHFYDRVTTAVRWESEKAYAAKADDNAPEKPAVTLNFAFTFNGLLALGVPIRTLAAMPPEFMQGMRARAPILGDTYPAGALDEWDEVWKHEDKTGHESNVHILALLNAQMDPATGQPVPELEELTEEIRERCAQSEAGVRILTGHGKAKAEYQEMSAVLRKDEETGEWKATPLEHFGFVDGISDPVFEGQYDEEDEAQRKVGNGKFTGELKTDKQIDDPANWQPLATGEFLLGYPDEAKEVPPAAPPNLFSTNGTFFAYRKLEERVDVFRKHIEKTAPLFAKVYGIDDPKAAEATLMAKFAGRWQDGVPLALAPTYAAWQEFNEKFSDWREKRARLARFTYADDRCGAACPASAHIRRVHPRETLGPYDESGTTLVNRRRLLRRGLPYDTSEEAGESEQGIIIMAVCASLERQFEFVQQQWIEHGMDANAGNDTCPLTGNRPTGDLKFVIPASDKGKGSPFIDANLPQFVQTRGGAYFFMPSMTCLRMIAIGVIDPT